MYNEYSFNITGTKQPNDDYLHLYKQVILCLADMTEIRNGEYTVDKNFLILNKTKQYKYHTVIFNPEKVAVLKNILIFQKRLQIQ